MDKKLKQCYYCSTIVGKQSSLVELPPSCFEHLKYSTKLYKLWSSGGFECLSCGLRAPKKTWERLNDPRI